MHSVSRAERLEAIKKLVMSKRVCCQQDLVECLADSGYNVTQATVSRDLLEIGARRVKGDDGLFQYQLDVEGPVGSHRSIPGMAWAVLKSCHAAANQVLCSTDPGAAGLFSASVDAAGLFSASVDAAGLHGVLGTVAGYNTVLVICEDGAAAVAVSEFLNSKG